MIISLKDFALTGKLGDLAVGSSKTDVLKSLGSPKKIEDHTNGTGALFYNGFRFFYSISNEKIYAIICQDFEESFNVQPVSKLFEISNTVSFDTEFFCNFGESKLQMRIE